MSQTLKALQSSEQGYNSHQASTPLSMGVAPQKRSPMAIHLTWLLLPAIFAGGLAMYNQYQVQSVEWQLTNQGQEVTVEVPAPVTIEPYIGIQKLASTEAEQSFVEEVAAAPVASSKAIKPAPIADATPKVKVTKKRAQITAQPADEPLLENIDLSELSPEILQRVEAVMAGSGTTQKTDIDDLSQSASKWQGKLPALNFQTHVYTTDVNKRWVKINDVEYKQGDWISDNLKLVTIEPQACVIRYNKDLIRVPALYEWNG